MATAKPTRLTIRSYQVGFGDCFLLSFAYPSRQRHVLIDFGSSEGPPGAPKGFLRQVADDIRTRCNGKLDAVVVTHRHLDHISGFDPGAKNQGPGAVIAACKPEVVVQPWTEDPKAKVDARKATRGMQGLQAFRRRLADMQSTAGALVAEVRRLRPRPEQFAELAFLGEQNLGNLAAVKNLQAMGKRHAYVHHGSRSGLEAVLPGVKVHVMGPPTLEQTETIRKQRQKDEDQFWHLQALAGARTANGTALPWSGCKCPPYARWLRYRLMNERAQAALELVRILDNVLNNTSVILLFEAGGKKFLFPGDAQIENWAYALGRKADLARLATTDVYKVGHHGSLNATPRTLWNAFKRRGAAGARGRLVTFLSTLPGKHGSVASKTEVPRRTLVSALERDSTLFDTERLARGVAFHEHSFKL